MSPKKPSRRGPNNVAKAIADKVQKFVKGPVSFDKKPITLYGTNMAADPQILPDNAFGTSYPQAKPGKVIPKSATSPTKVIPKGPENSGVSGFDVSDRVSIKQDEMLKFRNFGKKSLAEINKILVDMGISLGIKVGEDQSREESK